MIKEHAKVIAVNGDQVSIEVGRNSACGHCSARNGCGTSILDRFFKRTRNHMVLKSELDIAIGDELIVGLQEDALIKGSFIVYTVPLLLMLIVSVVAKQISGSEPVSIMGAVTGFILGLLYVRYFSRSVQDDERFHPIIISHVSSRHIHAGGSKVSQELL